MGNRALVLLLRAGGRRVLVRENDISLRGEGGMTGGCVLTCGSEVSSREGRGEGEREGKGRDGEEEGRGEAEGKGRDRRYGKRKGWEGTERERKRRRMEEMEGDENELK